MNFFIYKHKNIHSIPKIAYVFRLLDCCVSKHDVVDGCIQERILRLISLNSSKSEAQYQVIKTELIRLGLNLKHFIEESFDGAANMSRKHKGLQELIKAESPKSIFTHCHAQVINLVVGDISNCCIQPQNSFRLSQVTAVFFSDSYKRMQVWRNILSNSQSGNDKHCHLYKKIGSTRWNSKIQAFKETFHKLKILIIVLIV